VATVEKTPDDKKTFTETVKQDTSERRKAMEFLIAERRSRLDEVAK